MHRLCTQVKCNLKTLYQQIKLSQRKAEAKTLVLLTVFMSLNKSLACSHFLIILLLLFNLFFNYIII